MADLADIAQKRMEVEERLRRINTAPEAEATGCCLNCDTPLAEGRRWCDAECLEDWRRWSKRK